MPPATRLVPSEALESRGRSRCRDVSALALFPYPPTLEFTSRASFSAPGVFSPYCASTKPPNISPTHPQRPGRTNHVLDLRIATGVFARVGREYIISISPRSSQMKRNLTRIRLAFRRSKVQSHAYCVQTVDRCKHELRSNYSEMIDKLAHRRTHTHSRRLVLLRAS
jgi:hypothetical protein